MYVCDVSARTSMRVEGVRTQVTNFFFLGSCGKKAQAIPWRTIVSPRGDSSILFY